MRLVVHFLGILKTKTSPLALKQLSQPRATSRVYVGNLNTETSAVCTSQLYYLCIIFSMARLINKRDLVEFLEDKVNCIQFLCDEGLLNTQKLCSECDSVVNLKKITDRILPYFVCERRHKRIRISCAKGTWYENTKMSPLQVMLMTLFYNRDFI